MEDRFAKYLRLFGTIFFSLVGFIVVLILLLLGIKLLFGLMQHIPWFTYVYKVFILLIPSSLFITCYLVYFRRTAKHPDKTIKWLSYCLFTAALIAWAIFLVLDIITFYKHAYTEIGMYHTYNLLFLFINVACFFIIGIMQAFTTPKEKDWMERSRYVEEKN